MKGKTKSKARSSGEFSIGEKRSEVKEIFKEEGGNDMPEKASDTESDDETHHQNLIEAVLATTRKRSREPQRTEPASSPSEYNLSRPKGAQVSVDDLLSPLKNTKQFRSLNKRLRSVQDGSKTVDPPLPKVHAEKVQRKVMYAETSNQVSEWLPVIKRNREADHLYFTHQEGKTPHPSLNQLVESHKPRTPLEKEIASLLSNSEHAVPSPRDGLTTAERRSLERMALKEAKLRRQELLTMKSLLFYQERKFRREKRIKSKKFHKIRRKKKEKELQSKEGLTEEDVDKVLQTRAKERMTLKHSSHSKWVKKLKQTKNTELKQLVADAHQIGQELKEKAAISSESESSDNELYLEEDVSVEEDGVMTTVRSTNPWLSSKSEQVVPHQSTSQDCRVETGKGGSTSTRSVNNDEGPVLSGDGNDVGLVQDGQSAEKSHKKKKKKKKEKSIDLGNVLIMDVDTEDVNNMAAAEEQLLSIRSAFANDDVIEEFVKEKRDLEREVKDDVAETLLPGWGSWGGEGTTTSKRKQKSLKMPTKPIRKDSGLKHIIISEQRDRKFNRHQVNKVPFPFQSQNQFEKATCHPIGKHWNSESTFQQLIKPKVITQPGVTITPIHKTD